MTASSHQPAGVQRQIVLPLSTAVEIAYKSIRLRLSRSLLVTRGIVLALAFLMSILTTEAIINGMRAWGGQVITSPRIAELRQKRDARHEPLSKAETDELTSP